CFMDILPKTFDARVMWQPEYHSTRTRHQQLGRTQPGLSYAERNSLTRGEIGVNEFLIAVFMASRRLSCYPTAESFMTASARQVATYPRTAFAREPRSRRRALDRSVLAGSPARGARSRCRPASGLGCTRIGSEMF